MRRSGFFDQIKGAIARGVIYIGSSAGSVVAAPDIGYAAGLDDRSKSSLLVDTGLGLVDFKILPHMDHLDFGAKVREIYREELPGDEMCLGLNDNQLVVVEGRAFRIV